MLSSSLSPALSLPMVSECLDDNGLSKEITFRHVSLEVLRKISFRYRSTNKK